MSSKIEAGAPMPEMALPKVGGGTVQLGGPGRWQYCDKTHLVRPPRERGLT